MSNVIDFNDRRQAKIDEQNAERVFLDPEDVARKLREAAIEASLNQVVTQIGDRPVTRGELRDAFDLVCDTENWKNPIHRAIAYSGSDADDLTLELIRVAVPFFTGSAVTIKKGRDEVIVTADGYYNAIGS